MALLVINSVDSSGWRNRAARGIIQLPGSGERLVADLGNWRCRRPSSYEWKLLHYCGCPARKQHGVVGLRADKLHGFRCRATHNPWVLLEENLWLQGQLEAGTYSEEYGGRVDNSVYHPIIDELLLLLRKEDYPALCASRADSLQATQQPAAQPLLPSAGTEVVTLAAS